MSVIRDLSSLVFIKTKDYAQLTKIFQMLIAKQIKYQTPNHLISPFVQSST
jgi:hypothetical protein